MGGKKDLGPHFGRTDKGWSGPLEALLPVYDKRHSLHQSADLSRYAPDSPRLLELADSIGETGFLIQAGVARRNGTWKVCPVCRSKNECPIIEVIAGNRRHRALGLANAGREGLDPIPYTFTVRPLADRAATELMLAENNARQENSILASIRQGVMVAVAGASPEQIRRCFPGKNSKAVGIVNVMVDCEPEIWEAFAEGKIKLPQARAIAKHSRAAQGDALAQVLAEPKPAPAPRPAKLSSDERGALGRLLRLLPLRLSAATLEGLFVDAGLSGEQVDALREKLPAAVAKPEAVAPAKQGRGRRAGAAA